jgi:hypothetical protein
MVILLLVLGITPTHPHVQAHLILLDINRCTKYLFNPFGSCCYHLLSLCVFDLVHFGLVPPPLLCACLGKKT